MNFSASVENSGHDISSQRDQLPKYLKISSPLSGLSRGSVFVLNAVPESVLSQGNRIDLIVYQSASFLRSPREILRLLSNSHLCNN